MERALSELLKSIAEKKNLDLEIASKFFDSCILTTSIKLNMNYRDVYNMIYNEEFLLQCISKSCDKLTLDECRNSCHCVEFEGKCISRKMKDADAINRNPDVYITTLSLERLTELVKIASFLYYNYDGGGLTDNSYDALEYHLRKRLNAKGRLYEKIGADPIQKIREKLPYPMPSLTKMKPESRELKEWLSIGNTKYVVSEKLDGVSAMLIYKNRKLESIYTRGNGDIGGNVTYLKKYIKFPDIVTRDLVVRGEFVLSKNKWDEKYAGSYANPRSFVSAKINSGFIAPLLGELEDYIFDNYGDLSTTVTSSVSAVITASVGNVTKKMEEASSLKVPVYNVEEFCKYIGVSPDDFKK